MGCDHRAVGAGARGGGTRRAARRNLEEGRALLDDQVGLTEVKRAVAELED